MDELTFEKYVSLIQSMSVNMQMGKIDRDTYISNLRMIVDQLELSNDTKQKLPHNGEKCGGH